MDDLDQVRQQLKEAESFKRLEMGELENKYQQTEMKLKNEISELNEKLANSEKLTTDLREQIVSLSEAKSKLMTVANESQAEYSKASKEMSDKLNELEKNCYQRELLIKEKDSECVLLKKKFDHASQELNECVSKLNSAEASLNLKCGELTEMQRKLCDSLMDKDDMNKRHDAAIKRYEEQQQKMRHQMELLKRAVESGTSSASQAAEVSRLQAQLATTMEERMAQLTEIQNLKRKLDQCKDEHKENKQLKQKIVKKNEEIEKLKEEMKAMRESNDTLVMQINNMNDYVCQLSGGNKENKENTSVIEDGFELVARAPVKKSFNDISNSMGGNGGDSPAAKKPTPNTQLNDENMPTTPGRSWLSRSSAAAQSTNTPTSSARRQGQCAQQ